MTKKIRGAAFDLEGTLVDTETLHFRAHAAAGSRCDIWNGTALSAEFIMALPSAIGGGDLLIAEKLRELSGGALDVNAHLKAKEEIYLTSLKSSRLNPRSGCVTAMACLWERSLPMAIGSLTPRARGTMLLERSCLNEMFPSNLRVFAEDVERVKPHPDIFQRTAELLGISPDEQLVFEDSVPGVQAAIEAGCRVVAVPVFPELGEKLADAGAFAVCGSWQEVDLPDLLDRL